MVRQALRLQLQHRIGTILGTNIVPMPRRQSLDIVSRYIVDVLSQIVHRLQEADIRARFLRTFYLRKPWFSAEKQCLLRNGTADEERWFTCDQGQAKSVSFRQVGRGRRSRPYFPECLRAVLPLGGVNMRARQASKGFSWQVDCSYHAGRAENGRFYPGPSNRPMDHWREGHPP